MRIGSHVIGEGAALAPMAGITNPPFRQLCREHGAVLAVSELISCHAVLVLEGRERRRNARARRLTRALIGSFPGEQPFAVQLCGREPELMAEAARIVEQHGAQIIDLNFGCPARKVAKQGEGAGVALMRDPPRLAAVARAVVDAVALPVTAKIRTGWAPGQRNGAAVARMLEDTGVQAICVHARTRDQVHSGPVDLDTLAAICAAVRLPVIGNGGIRDRAAAAEMIARTGCARVAVGQGAKGNPWIFDELAGRTVVPDLAERVATCRRHLDLYVEWIGEARAAREMRKHACWYIKGFPGAAAFRAQLSRATDRRSFSALLDELQ
jgi:tRNA-dihydrouridine synthase B